MSTVAPTDWANDHYIDPARPLNIHSRRTLGNPSKCWYCGAVGRTEGDHFYPKSLGGVLKVRSCVPCNREKADLTPLEWLNYLEQLMRNCQRSRKGCTHGKYIKSTCTPHCSEYAKFQRMHRATSTLWQRIAPC